MSDLHDCAQRPPVGAPPQSALQRPASFRAGGLDFRLLDAPSAVEQSWRLLEQDAFGSLFQTYLWCDTWCRAAAPLMHETPVIAAGSDAAGRVVAILPLAVRRRLGVNTLGWLGCGYINYGMALLARDLACRLDRQAASGIVRAVANHAGAAAISLSAQPSSWGGIANPFLGPGAKVGANDSYLVPLGQPYEQIYCQRFSKTTRAALGRKLRKARALGAVITADVEGQDERAQALSAFFAQKRAQLAAAGAASPFDRPALRAFYEALAARASLAGGGLGLRTLEIDGEIVAVALSARHGERQYILNTSYAAGRFDGLSPGRLLIDDDIAQACAAGLGIYDLGPGQTSLKEAWKAEPVPLLETHIALDGRGALSAAAGAAKARIKHLIKRTPVLWQVARRLRRLGSAR